MLRMTVPSGDRDRVPLYVAFVRVAAVVGMATALAAGIFLLVGGWWWPSLVAFALAVPAFLVMRLVERAAGAGEPPPAP